MRRYLAIPLFFFLAASCSRSARADTFTFNLVGNGLAAIGTFTAVQNTSVTNGWNVTAISGQVNGIQIAQLVPGSWDPAHLTSVTLPNFFFNFDNVLYGSTPHVDVGGILFKLTDSTYVNFYHDSTMGDTYLDSNNLQVALSNFASDVPLTATPEPSSIALLGVGLAGLTNLARRRRSA